MEIDFSPLQSSIEAIFFGVLNFIGLPLVGALILGFLLEAIKVPRKIVIIAAIALFLFVVYQKFTLAEI